MISHAHIAATPSVAEPSATAERIVLLVEDEQPFRELLTEVLQTAGYRVRAAADGRVALRALAEHRIDLIVTDLCMPGTDGMEFLTALRKTRSRVPVMVMSGGVGSNMAGMLRAAQLLGARCTLEKPFSLAKFVQAVRDVMPPA